MNIEDILSGTQLERYKLAEKLGSIRQAHRESGEQVSWQGYHESVKKAREKLAKAGISDEKVPEGYEIIGKTYGSFAKDEDGNTTVEWTKTRLKQDVKNAVLNEILEIIREDTPRVDPIPCLIDKLEDTISVYPIGDSHVGMYSWYKETGISWDLKKTQKAHIGAMKYLVNQAPPSKYGLVLSLGDFFQSENQKGETVRSGTKLDVDSRFSKCYDIGIKIIRAMIDLALSKHEKVFCGIVLGNHDDISSRTMSTLIRAVYENEPRLEVIGGYSPFITLEIGGYGMLSTHGHEAKLDGIKSKLLNTLTNAKRTWVYCGHIHSQKVHDIGRVVIEYFRNLAPSEYYSEAAGYPQTCEMQVRTYSIETGVELNRVIYTPDYSDYRE